MTERTVNDSIGISDSRPATAASCLEQVRRRGSSLAGQLLPFSPYVTAAVFAVLYCVLSLSRHSHLQTAGYDLGIFAQAVKGYAHLSAPISEIKGAQFNLLGDHFHPILMVLAPVYRVFPSVRTLLVAQGVLLALSIVPIGRLAVRRLDPGRAYSVMVAYGLSWGLQGAVGFDFHEIAFAVPLLAFTVVALAEEKWAAAAASSLPLLLVKEDLGVTVAVVGLWLLVRRRRLLGMLVLGTSIVVTACAVLYVIPHFNPYGVFRYWEVLGGDPYGGPGQVDIVRLLLRVPLNLFVPASKLLILGLLLASTLGAVLFSRLSLLAVPTLIWRLSSQNPMFWRADGVHYNAVLMPIMIVALVDAVGRLRPNRRRVIRSYARLTAPAALVVALAMVPLLPFQAFLTGDVWQPNPRAASAREVLTRIPVGSRVAASNFLAPQLVDRCDVVLFPRQDIPGQEVDWIVVDSKYVRSGADSVEAQVEGLAGLLGEHSDFRVVTQQDGFFLFVRR